MGRRTLQGAVIFAACTLVTCSLGNNGDRLNARNAGSRISGVHWRLLSVNGPGRHRHQVRRDRHRLPEGR